MKFYYMTLFYFLGILSSAVSEWDDDCHYIPDLVSDDTCCNNGIFLASDDDDDEICMDRFNVTAISESDDFTTEHLNTLFCHFECYFNETNYIKNGTIDIDKFTSGIFEIAEAKNVTDLAVLYKDAVSYCLSQMDELVENFINETPEFLINGTCSPNTFLLTFCVNIRYLQSCPAEYWSKENPSCKDAKLFLEKCDLFQTDESSAVSEWDGDCNNSPDVTYDDTCCNNGIFYALDDDEDDDDEICMDRFNVTAIPDSADLTTEHLNTMLCHFECYFNETNYIKNGTIDIDELTSGTFQIAEAENVTDLAIIYKDAVTYCLSQMDELVKKFINDTPEYLINGTCSPNTYLLNFCLNRRYLKSCPADYWSEENPACKDAKLFLEKCPDHLHPN